MNKPKLCKNNWRITQKVPGSLRTSFFLFWGSNRSSFFSLIRILHNFGLSFYCREMFISDPTPPPKKGIFWGEGGYVFLNFFHEFLRWAHKIYMPVLTGWANLPVKFWPANCDFLPLIVFWISFFWRNFFHFIHF